MDIPEPHPWERRANSVSPMPGGYTGYLDSFRTICERVEQGSTSSEELVEWLAMTFDLSETSARVRISFLQSASLLSSGIVSIDEHLHQWLEGGPSYIPIAIIHSRIRFVGEMMKELRQPRSAEGLRREAARYGLDWQTLSQIDSRRGWLQSAKLIEGSNDRLSLTDAGRDLLDDLTLHVPSNGPDSSPTPTSEKQHLEPSPPPEASASPEIADADRLAEELVSASIASSEPVRFERSVRKAFLFLGFVAEHLGGPGGTDVLLTAQLGEVDSYRVAVDAKTTASGSLKDQQVDWHSLEDHRDHHRATYSMLVAPSPSGERLMNRAIKSSVAVLSAEQLADLCRRHARTPLNLLDYRRVFETPGEVDLTVVDDASERISSFLELVGRLCDGLAEKTNRFGRMSARDVQLAFGEEGDEISQEEIQQLLELLDHPLIGVISGRTETPDSTKKYVLASSAAVSAQRIRILADRVAAPIL